MVSDILLNSQKASFGNALDRYEGSKDWETMISQGRNLARQLWISVGVSDSSAATRSPEDLAKDHQVLREEKIRAMNLVTAFLVGVKHHLRSEPGSHHPDFDGLLPDYFSRFDHETTNQHEHTGDWETPNHNSGASTPHPTRIRDVGTSQVYPDHRTPLLKDQHHIVHFHPCVLVKIPLESWH